MNFSRRPSRSDGMTIARHFNAGFNPQTFQVPQGRPTFSNETMAMTETVCRPVSRPCGTYAGADNDPALKRRAIFGLSRWDEQKRSVAVPGHSNARTATRFGQTDAGRLCHVAAPGDGRTPAVGGKLPLPNSVWNGRPGQMAFEFLPSESNQMFSIVEELNFVIEPQISPYCGPLIITHSLESAAGDNIITNGSFGLVDTGKKKLLVTCHHVWKKFQEERLKDSNVRMCVFLDRKQAKAIVFDQQDPIDQDAGLDIATFDMAPVLAACMEREFYPLNRNPAPRVTKGNRLVLKGYPGIARAAAEEGLDFGVMTYACEVSDVSGLKVVADLSKATMKYYEPPVRTPKPETSPHGGISGSPCFLVRDNRPVRLVGFATDDWQNSLWFIHARCLNPDGTINKQF
jgi:hypothetical protein